MTDNVRDLLRWYLKRAQLADHMLLGGRKRACAEPIAGIDVEDFVDVGQARSWIARNQRNLFSLVQTASAGHWHFEAWALAEAMWVYYRTSTRHDDAQRCYEMAVAEAIADGNAEANVQMQLLLARVLASGEIRDEVENQYDRHARLYRDARNGDKNAQRALVEELNELLWRAARRTGLDRDSALDVVHTAWLRLWHADENLPQPRALTKWLLVTVSREAWRVIGHARRNAITDPVDLTEPSVSPRDAQTGAVIDAERAALRRAFLKLPERCRRLLSYIAAVDRPDYDVIAEALGMKRGSIGPTRGRCLNKLRTLLESDPEWNKTRVEEDRSVLSEDDPLDADDNRVIELVDEIHVLYDPCPVG